MEFIDGEDLASLIRRIGYLSNEKALDLARQLVAGLAAAHERGVLHRDLKPANIMIDGHGRVRITDFGIAILAEDEEQAAEISGTPAYMAPEQLAGKGATVRSDIYALGLILYEIACGRKAFTAGTIAELREQKEGHTPRAPSEIHSGVDPILERLITRCMDRDPRMRPGAATQIGAALPGGDPLAAAIAAGETPSPEMVAASSSKEGLHPAAATALVVLVILGLISIAALNPRAQIFQLAPGKPPEILAYGAREFLAKAGYSNSPGDRAFDYTFLPVAFDRLSGIPNVGRILAASGFNLGFWYRESPQPLEHMASAPMITLDDPPMKLSGEASVGLDTEGRLRALRVVTLEQAPAGPQEPGWSFLFKAAGFDESAFTRVEMEHSPPVFADSLAAWKGTLPGAPEIPVHIEAAAYRGRPVYFEITAPWIGSPAYGRTEGFRVVFGFALPLLLLAGAVLLVRQNLRLGRGDRRGATKLAALSLAAVAVSWVLTEHHVAAGEGSLFFSFASSAVLMAAVIWIFYMGLEPVIRRSRPQNLISWTRILSGEWRDPLVGRDVLAGCAAGVLAAGFRAFTFARGDVQLGLTPTGVLGTRYFIAAASSLAVVISALGFLVMFFLVRKLFRRDWVIVTVVGVILTALVLLSGGGPALFLVPVAVLLLVLLPIRLGVLASAVSVFAALLLAGSPMTFDTSAWYFGSGLAAFVLILGLSLLGYRVALGGRRMMPASDYE